MRKFTYKHTMLACYMSYVTSAVINNLAPLLFVTFRNTFGLTLEQLAFIVTMNFGVQIAVDFAGAKYADRLGYRKIVLAAQVFSVLGLVSLGVLPVVFDRVWGSAFSGIIVSAVIYAVGSGLTEVVISPIIEALPGEAKASSMSLLHSFYCWGHVFMVVVTTLFFKIFGIENWSILCILWAILPAVTFFFFRAVPIRQLGAEQETQTSVGKLFGVKIMWVFLFLMLASGASEQSMCQWSSYFAELELGVSKQTADLLGPCMFAVTMGISRIIFAVISKKNDIRKSLFVCSLLSIVSYLLCAFSPFSALSLFGCALCGFSVGIMWPGVLSLSAQTYPKGGTAMFALLALAGDMGCFAGPETVARTSYLVSNNGEVSVKNGLAFAIVFPLFIAVSALVLLISSKRKSAK